MTMNSRTEKSGKHLGEGATALQDRVEATLGVILYMARLATDVHTNMGREALGRVERQRGKTLHSIKEGTSISLFCDDPEGSRVGVLPG